ncbi:cytochrome-c oxidase [Thalassobacillus sp. CUG 92003]|uniref:cytochrome-c oxidase n=1 Tax=Thalassobacillus sp. CUG 92003 TaxID=2736641 RepID=UPI0015E783ED|nr:cytochrome-c oxidase [Thalassobacillus sp. CUG 92003]
MGIRLIQISAVYFLIGVVLVYILSMVHDYTLTPVHVHINLMGWISLTLTGIIYHLFPKAAASRLGILHFWFHNLGLPIMMGSLALLILTEKAVFKIGLPIGATLLLVAVIFFVINVFKNVQPQK